MRLGIMCSSNDNLSLGSRLTFAEAISYVTNNIDYEIVMGAGETGLMGNIKELMQETNHFLTIIDYDKSKLINNNADKKILVSNQGARAGELYEQSDIVIFGPGGIGTDSEFFTMLTTKLELNDYKPLIIYNEDHSYDILLKELEYKERLGALTKAYKTYYDIATTKKDLEQLLKKYEIKIEKGKSK